MCVQLLATAMEINDTRSIIRMLPQQTVVTLPADPDLPASSTEGQQQLPQSQPSQVRNASTTAQLMQKLGAALPAAVSSTQPGAVLPIQGALPYGNTTAGGAFSQPATGQPGALVQSQTAEAAASANASTAGTLSSAAGRLLPAQAWQGYPEHNPSAHNTTGTDLYTSTGAAGQQQEAGVDLTRSCRIPVLCSCIERAKQSISMSGAVSVTQRRARQASSGKLFMVHHSQGCVGLLQSLCATRSHPCSHQVACLQGRACQIAAAEASCGEGDLTGAGARAGAASGTGPRADPEEGHQGQEPRGRRARGLQAQQKCALQVLHSGVFCCLLTAL